MVKFVFIRHGYSEANKRGIFTGQLDAPLTDEGRAQAESVCSYVRDAYKIDAIYSSDLSRAYDTVRPLADMLGLEIRKEPRFREVDTGVWTAVPCGDIKERYPERFNAFCNDIGNFVFDGGESALDVVERTCAALADIARMHDGQTVAIGTHAGVIRRTCATWQGLVGSRMSQLPPPSNASVTVVEYDRGSVVIQVYGYDDYLSERACEVPIDKI